MFGHKCVTILSQLRPPIATTKMSRLARLPKTTCVCCCSVRMFGQGARFYSALLAARLACLPETTCVCCCSGRMFGQGGRFYSALLAVWKRPRASLEAAKASGATRSASADGPRRPVWRLSGGVWRVPEPAWRLPESCLEVWRPPGRCLGGSPGRLEAA